MHHLSDSLLEKIALHKVGNKAMEEKLFLSKNYLKTYEKINNVLSSYFLTPFKLDEYFNFHHESNLDLNEVYVFASKIFDNSEELFDQSINIAKHLFEKSVHPKIKGGEFYTVYFKECIIDGETVDAIGLFKSENKDVFIKVYPAGDNFELETDNGININKLDKGCLIFNTDRENGYVVAVVDNTNRGAEAQYWIDDFLHLRHRKDNYHNTQNLLNLCKNFVTKELPNKFEISKADQIDFLNKSLKFFKEKDSFNSSEFENEVVFQPEVIEVFKKYKDNFKSEHEIDIADNFEISNSALKKQAKIMKSIIKLDKNFHIYIHGNRELIEQGMDEDGRKFYKIYYREES